MTLIDFVKRTEGCAKLRTDGLVESYWDAEGHVWTIGYGTTGPGIVQGTVWTMAQCEAALQKRLDEARAQLLALSPSVSWVPGAQDALTDFVYNEGAEHYSRSTVRTAAEAGDWAAVKARLLDWDYAGGKPRAGLLTRREAEGAMIESDSVFVPQ